MTFNTVKKAKKKKCEGKFKREKEQRKMIFNDFVRFIIINRPRHAFP